MKVLEKSAENLPVTEVSHMLVLITIFRVPLLVRSYIRA